MQSWVLRFSIYWVTFLLQQVNTEVRTAQHEVPCMIGASLVTPLEQIKVQALKYFGTCPCLLCQLLPLPAVPIAWTHVIGCRGSLQEKLGVMRPLLGSSWQVSGMAKNRQVGSPTSHLSLSLSYQWKSPSMGPGPWRLTCTAHLSPWIALCKCSATVASHSSTAKMHTCLSIRGWKPVWDGLPRKEGERGCQRWALCSLHISFGVWDCSLPLFTTFAGLVTWAQAKGEEERMDRYSGHFLVWFHLSVWMDSWQIILAWCSSDDRAGFSLQLSLGVSQPHLVPVVKGSLQEAGWDAKLVGELPCVERRNYPF